MKKTTLVTEFTDDLDGSTANVQTVKFGFDGAELEIDLSRKNRTAMEKLLKPYIDAGRKTSGRRGRVNGKTRAVAGAKKDLSVIRAWATANGMSVSTRGRIAGDVLSAYDAAH